MGCDIHTHVEVKIAGVWQHYNQPRLERDYDLFSRMANVRNDPKDTAGYTEPISSPRGLPDDITWMTRFDADHWNGDGHSHSWLSSREVAELIEWYEAQRKKRGQVEWYSFEHKQIGYIFGNGWDIAKYPDDYPKGVEDARIVFWFDN